MVVVGGDARCYKASARGAPSVAATPYLLTRGLGVLMMAVGHAGAVWGLCRAARAEGTLESSTLIRRQHPESLTNTPEAAWRKKTFSCRFTKVEVEASDDVGGGVHVVVGGAGGRGGLGGAPHGYGPRRRPSRPRPTLHAIFMCHATSRTNKTLHLKKAKAHQKPISVWHLAGVLDDASI